MVEHVAYIILVYIYLLIEIKGKFSFGISCITLLLECKEVMFKMVSIIVLMLQVHIQIPQHNLTLLQQKLSQLKFYRQSKRKCRPRMKKQSAMSFIFGISQVRYVAKSAVNRQDLHKISFQSKTTQRTPGPMTKEILIKYSCNCP